MLTVLAGSHVKTDLAGLRKVKVTPKGDRTDRWMGIQHAELVEALSATLKDRFGLIAIEPTYAVSPNGASMIGGFQLGKQSAKAKNPSPLVIPGLPQKTIQAIGFSHSNDSRKALKLAMGSRVFLCDNGAVWGQMVMKRKHTTGLSLSDWLGDGVEVLLSKNDSFVKVAQMLASHPMSFTQHEQSMLYAGRYNYLDWSLLGFVDRYWRKALGLRPAPSRHNEDELITDVGEELPWINPEHGKAADWKFESSLLDWYNCANHVCKKISPAEQLESLEGLFKVAVRGLPSKLQKEADKLLTIDALAA